MAKVINTQLEDPKPYLRSCINHLNAQIEMIGREHNMNKNQLLRSLQLLPVSVSVRLKPLLEERIYLLKHLWKLENGHTNLLLFSRTK